eukprot:459350_1
MKSMNSNNTKFNVPITGKYVDFKREEYSIMMTRIESINKVMTEKCKMLSLKSLEKNFSFDFVFCGMGTYLKKIDEYDKKARKDDLKKWWMNQKASEMAKDCLPAILDRMDQISTTIAKQERSELSRNKFEKYIKFELLETALKSSFRRPRASSANVFPNTSFQYARSRLRKKLENTYFKEAELINMTVNDKKKKDEWIKLIEEKKNKFKDEYEIDKNKKKMKAIELKRKQQDGQKSLVENSECEIYSDSDNKWYKGKVKHEKKDDNGTLLYVEYKVNDELKTIDIQKYDKNIRLLKTETVKENIDDDEKDDEKDDDDKNQHELVVQSNALITAS